MEYVDMNTAIITCVAVVTFSAALVGCLRAERWLLSRVAELRNVVAILSGESWELTLWRHRVEVTKNGGLWFWRVGRLGGSLYVRRER